MRDEKINQTNQKTKQGKKSHSLQQLGELRSQHRSFLSGIPTKSSQLKSLKFKSLRKKIKTPKLCRRKTLHLDGMIPTLWPDITMRKERFHSVITSRTEANTWFEFSALVFVMYCQHSHLYQTRSRQIQILCCREVHLSFGELFSKRKTIIYQNKGLHFFSALMLLRFSNHTVWGHEELSQKMIPGTSRKPLLEIHLFSWLLPQNSPPGTILSRQKDGWPRSSPISAVHDPWSASRADCLQSTKPLPPWRFTHQAHSNSLQKQ